MYYDGFECCQCSCPCHRGDDGLDVVTGEVEEYPTGERNLERNGGLDDYFDESEFTRLDEVQREIDTVQRKKERLARDRENRWTVRSDGAVTCAGSDGQPWMNPGRSGTTYFGDRYDTETADGLFGVREAYKPEKQEGPKRMDGGSVCSDSSWGETVDRFGQVNDKHIPKSQQRQGSEATNKEEKVFDEESSDAPGFGVAVGEKSDEELDKVISHLGTAKSDVANRLTVSDMKDTGADEVARMSIQPIPVIDIIPETNPADWDPNDFKAAFFAREQHATVKAPAVTKAATVKAKYLDGIEVGRVRNDVSWRAKKLEGRRYPGDGKYALRRPVPEHLAELRETGS